MKKNTLLSLLLISTLVLISLTRLMPHWPNFTPVMAVALLGGVFFSSKRAGFLIPLGIMVLSDVALGITSGWSYALHDTQVVVYAALAVIFFLGSWMRNESNVKLVLGGGTLAGVLFFLTTNAAVWMFGSMYPHNLTGLMMSYEAGLAFYKDGGNFLLNALASTWLFAGLALAVRKYAGRSLNVGMETTA